MSRKQVASKLMRSTHLMKVNFESSYYANKNRLQESLDLMQDSIQQARNIEDIRTPVVRDMERMHYYGKKRVENDDENLRELKHVVKIITNGFAWKIENPADFNGYSSEIKTHADEIGIQIRTETP